MRAAHLAVLHPGSGSRVCNNTFLLAFCSQHKCLFFFSDFIFLHFHRKTRISTQICLGATAAGRFVSLTAADFPGFHSSTTHSLAPVERMTAALRFGWLFLLKRSPDSAVIAFVVASLVFQCEHGRGSACFPPSEQSSGTAERDKIRCQERGQAVQLRYTTSSRSVCAARHGNRYIQNKRGSI